MNFEDILLKVQKPSRYTGGESGSIVKDKSEVDTRFAFCFPDKYEIGMSHLGMKILYGALNSMDGVWCERVFHPDKDMEEIMRKERIPLWAIESHDPLSEFDFIGFTLQFELCYTGVLNMLELGNVPLRSKDRKGLKNIVVMGGPCAYNPEPLAEFADIFSIGEGEEALPELAELFRECRKNGDSREEFLFKASQLEGFYVPSLYNVKYNDDNTIAEFIPVREGVPAKVRKRIIKDLDNSYFPDNFIVPFTDIVHNRATIEVFRGCIRGCRFCQAGYVYRPVRQKSPDVLNKQAKSLCDNTGYDELGFCSLSTSDYTHLSELLDEMLDWTLPKRINLSLPSLRIDNFSEELLEKIKKVRQSGLTFAPEGGTQRIRDAINKNITEDDIFRSCKIAFDGGYSNVKLYFMLGLPTETDEDVVGIADLATRVLDCYYDTTRGKSGPKRINITMSTACFVPKPFTPFQWEAQDTEKMMERKQRTVAENIRSRKITYNYHSYRTSYLEAVFARGDRRLADVIELAHKKGCTLDGWDEYFLYDAWMDSFKECGVDPDFYACRRREYDEILPWDFLDIGVDKSFFIRENERSKESKTSPNCRENCMACGANKLIGGKCFEEDKN